MQLYVTCNFPVVNRGVTDEHIVLLMPRPISYATYVHASLSTPTVVRIYRVNKTRALDFFFCHTHYRSRGAPNIPSEISFTSVDAVGVAL